MDAKVVDRTAQDLRAGSPEAEDAFSRRQHDAFGDISIVPRVCPQCGDQNTGTPASRYSLGQWTIKDCRRCNLTYITSSPDYDTLFVQMAWEKSFAAENAWREETRGGLQSLSKKTRWRLHILPRKQVPDLLARYAEPGNVIDLGCGSGGHFDGLAEAFVPFGVEISKDLAAGADARFAGRGGRVVNAPSLEGLKEFPAAFFSAATLRSYLEHELHPAEVLAALFRVLKPGGIAVVKVPNYGSWNRRIMGSRWCGFRHPDHLNYFTPATLTDIARRAGFRAWFGPTWKLPTSDNMWALFEKPA